MNKETLKNELLKLNLDTSKIELLEDHMFETLKVNNYFNLTAIKDEENFRELMILDSAYTLQYFDFTDKKIIDIGTGAGYPGLVLSILSNGQFTLLDSTNKKVKFLRNFSTNHQLFNVNCVCSRAEEYAKTHREEFDFAVARAVSELPVLLELILPLLKVGGSFIALKGSKGINELHASKNALEKLGGVVYKIDEYELPESKEKRVNIIVKKIKQTPNKFPREYNQIISKKL